MMTKVYFPNCNGIRSIASILVVAYHIEQVKKYFHIPNHADNKFLYAAGTLGIISFFVLSGFLITYLLLKEKEETGDVQFRSFYLRRILRLWPLYYLIIILSLFILPHIPFFSIPILTDKVQNSIILKTLLFALMLPNLAVYRFGIIPFASQTWSIGVEEQCYIIWPYLIKRFRNTFKVFWVIILTYLLIKFALLIAHHHYPKAYLVDLVTGLWVSFSIDCMAVGGLTALILYHQKKRLLNILFHKYTQIAVYLLLAVLSVSGFRFYEPLFYEFYSILFAVIILNLAANKKSILNIENGFFNYIGKISYGIYMYHVIAIVIVLRLTSITSPNNIILYLGSFLLTLIMSVLSYELFEKKFIRSKFRFSRVISGENARLNKDQTPAITNLNAGLNKAI